MSKIGSNIGNSIISSSTGIIGSSIKGNIGSSIRNSIRINI